MAVVKSLKNAKHKRLWVKKFASINKNSLLVSKNKSKMSLYKPLQWSNSKKKKNILLKMNSVYGIVYNCY